MFDLFVMRVYIALDCLRQRLSVLLRSKTAEAKFPDYIFTDLAHAFLADIKEFFTNEENQAKFQKWKLQREKSAADKATKNMEHKTNTERRR